MNLFIMRACQPNTAKELTGGLAMNITAHEMTRTALLQLSFVLLLLFLKLAAK